MDPSYVAIALLAGLVPALFWLWFWLREDKEHPEPYLLVALSFLAGMLVVPIALPLQKYAIDIYDGKTVVLVWVILEELLKYAAALIVILWNKEVDEPIDMVIYMITIALGFAALENALFIFNPLISGAYLDSALTGSFRFVGATLLHVLASATVGVFLAFAYYKSRWTQMLFGMVGLFIAIVLHALFNFFIMNASGETILGVFLVVWMGVILLFFLFEKIKRIRRPARRLR